MPHLEFICQVIQSRNRMHLQPGQNPTKARLRACLEDLLSSIFCETLGHENKPKYLSIHGPKVEKKDYDVYLAELTSKHTVLKELK